MSNFGRANKQVPKATKWILPLPPLSLCPCAMDAFLSTLPPHVHVYLSQHPPTDVFNVLRDLISFAVIYSSNASNIRDALKNISATAQTVDNTSVHVEQQTIARPNRTAHQSTTTAQTNTTAKAKREIPNIYPSWWGDQDDPDLWRVPKKMVDEMTQTINNFPAPYEPSTHLSHVSPSQALESDKRAPGYVAWIPASSGKPVVSLTSKDLPSFPKMPPGPRVKPTLTPSGRRQSMQSMPPASRGTGAAFVGRRRSEVKLQERVTREVVMVKDEEVDIDTETEREEWRMRRKKAYPVRYHTSTPTSKSAGASKRAPVSAIASEFLRSRFLECLDGMLGDGEREREGRGGEMVEV